MPKTQLSYASLPLIHEALSYYRTPNLRTDPLAFQARIEDYVHNPIPVAAQTPGHSSSGFRWAQDHDFGSFQVRGELGTRHIWMLSRFFDHFGAQPAWLAGKDVLDAGCFTGGVSWILHWLGARVHALDFNPQNEPVLKYVADSFGLDRMQAETRSIYDLDARYRSRFDAVFCLGVVYHLSDPVLGLRRLYHVLKPGGTIFVESRSINHPERMCALNDPGRFGFLPSPRALHVWLEQAGFRDIRVGDGITPLTVTGDRDPMGPNRCFAVAAKNPGYVLPPGLSAADLT